MKHSMVVMFAVALLWIAGDLHAQTEVQPKSEPCDATCVSAPITRAGSAGAFATWWYQIVGYYPPKITTYTGGTTPAGPTISSYVPPFYGQQKTGVGSAACKLATEIHLKALLLSGLFDPTFLKVTSQMVEEACFPGSTTHDLLEGNEFAYAIFEEDLLLGAWIVDTWDPLLY